MSLLLLAIIPQLQCSKTVRSKDGYLQPRYVVLVSYLANVLYLHACCSNVRSNEIFAFMKESSTYWREVTARLKWNRGWPKTRFEYPVICTDREVYAYNLIVSFIVVNKFEVSENINTTECGGRRKMRYNSVGMVQPQPCCSAWQPLMKTNAR